MENHHEVEQCCMVRAHAVEHTDGLLFVKLTEHTAIGNTSGAVVRSRAGASACLTLDCPSASFSTGHLCFYFSCIEVLLTI